MNNSEEDSWARGSISRPLRNARSVRELIGMLKSAVDHRLDLRRVARDIDMQGLDALRVSYKGTPYENSKHWAVRERLSINLRHLRRLGLHRTTGLDILDLGTGCGFFPFLCGFYGHSAIGIDVDVPMYGDVAAELGVDRRVVPVNAFSPLPSFNRKFDLVTALLAWFHCPLDSPWGVLEWKFLLSDLARNHLKPSGRLFLTLGSRTIEGTYYTEEVGAFLRSVGAIVNDEVISIPAIRLVE